MSFFRLQRYNKKHFQALATCMHETIRKQAWCKPSDTLDAIQGKTRSHCLVDMSAHGFFNASLSHFNGWVYLGI